MGEELRLLLVEDSDDDAELLLRQVRRGGFDPRPRRVLDEPGLGAALAADDWDAAILDYSLPSFNALAALAVFAELRPELPIVVVSGVVGDDQAVQTLRAGAYDYVLKDNLTRLVPAIRRGLREAAAQRAHRQVAAARDESERRYRLLFERSVAGVMEMLPDGTIVGANPAMAVMLACSGPDELVGRSCADLYWDDAERLRLLAAVREAGAVSGRQLRLRRFDGRELWLLADIVLVEHDDGHLSLFAVALDMSELRATQDSLATSLTRLRSTFEETVECLASLTELRDPYTAGHQRRVAQLAQAIGTRLELPDEVIEGTRVAGALHDVGKIHVPAEILAKPGRLSDVEMAIIRTHPTTGWEILRSVSFPWPVAEIVLQHHERLDGSGYPRGLSGDEIRVEAGILAVADIVEAMSSHRPYRAAHGVERTLAHVAGQAGKAYRRDIAETCLRVWEDGFSFAPTA